MSCRCSDMHKCLNDISRMEDIKKLFNNMQSKNLSVSMELNSLAQKCLLTFFCVNMGELNFEEKQLNKDMTELLPKVLNKCQQKIENLHREYSSMRREDNEAHRKHRHS